MISPKRLAFRRKAGYNIKVHFIGEGNMKIKGLIFDLDGTLADTLPMIRKAINKTLTRFSQPELDRAGVLYGINDGPRMFVMRSFPQGTDEAIIDRATEQYIADYESTYMGTKEPYDGMVETLNTLKAEGCHVAVLTNKPHDAAVLLTEQIFGKEMFEEILGFKDHPIKPAPDTVLAMAARMGVRPDECCFVGDSHIDMQTGVNAKMHTIGMSYGYKGRAVLLENGAEYIADRPEDILTIVHSIK